MPLPCRATAGHARAYRSFSSKTADARGPSWFQLGSKQGPEQPGDDQLIMRCANDPNDILIMHGGGTGGRYSAIIDTTGYRIRTRIINSGAD